VLVVPGVVCIQVSLLEANDVGSLDDGGRYEESLRGVDVYHKNTVSALMRKEAEQPGTGAIGLSIRSRQEAVVTLVVMGGKKAEVGWLDASGSRKRFVVSFLYAQEARERQERFSVSGN